MNSRYRRLLAVAALLVVSYPASADFGVGVKAGTLGLGVEGRWNVLPWVDLRVGANQFDFEDNGTSAGIAYDANLGLDNFYLTGNFRAPLSPMRFTLGAYSNGNEYEMVSADTGANFNIGGSTFTAAEVGTLTGIASFQDTAPYVGVGFDFEVFGKAGINLDFGVLWQGEPNVALQADGQAADLQVFQDALEAERLELEDDLRNYKAWPVVSVGFVYNF